MKTRIGIVFCSFIHKTIFYFVLGLSLLMSLEAFLLRADEMPPPPSFPEAITVPATLKYKPATYLNLGKTVIRLEKTPLRKTLDILGIGYMERQGEQCGSFYKTCYRIPEPGQDQILWLISNAEMGGPEQVVTEIAVARQPKNDKEQAGCPVLPKSFRPLSIDRGIWIGTTKMELLRKLGKPSGMQEGWLVYYYSGPVKIKNDKPGQEEYLDYAESNLLAMRLVKDKVAGIRVFKVTTY